MTACGNLQLCAHLKAGIEVETHDVGQRRLETLRRQISKEEEADDSAEEE